MKPNKLKGLVAGSLLMMGMMSNAHAVIYDFGTRIGTTGTVAPSANFASLEVTQGSGNSFTFSLSFLNGFATSRYIDFLAVNTVNNNDAPDAVTNVSVVNAIGSNPAFRTGNNTVAETSGITGYDFDFDISRETLQIGETLTWTSTFANPPGGFSGFAIQVSTGNNGDFVGNYAGVARTVEAVPEPETYAMFLAGLGLLGFAARRKQA